MTMPVAPLRWSKTVSRVIAVALSTILVGQVSFAEDLYIAQTARGANTGVDVNNAHSVAWFNASTSWGDGVNKISRDDTVYLSDVLSDGLVIQGDGVTIKFLPGAKISSPVGSGSATANPALANYLINCSSHSDVTIDGQGSGVIECTSNGSELQYQLLVKMIQADFSTNLTVRGLTFRNGYVHTLVNDSALDGGLQGGIKSNPMAGNWLIENCSFSNVCWAISISNARGLLSSLTVRSNSFSHYDHGIGLGMPTNQPINISIISNYFGMTANWDTGANRYHHDGIHYYGAPNNPQSFLIAHNMFAENWGTNNTAHVFLETMPTNVVAYDNVFLEDSGNRLNNGFFVGANVKLFNNTFSGFGNVPNSTAVLLSGLNNQFVNNIVSGLTTLILGGSSGPAAFSVISNNVYANQIVAGNSMFRWNNVNYSTFAAWQTAVGDVNSQYVANVILNANGSLRSPSPAIGNGANLSSIFSDDIRFTQRVMPWDIGAYKVATTTVLPPTNLRIQ